MVAVRRRLFPPSLPSSLPLFPFFIISLYSLPPFFHHSLPHFIPFLSSFFYSLFPSVFFIHSLLLSLPPSLSLPLFLFPSSLLLPFILSFPSLHSLLIPSLTPSLHSFSPLLPPSLSLSPTSLIFSLLGVNIMYVRPLYERGREGI